MESLQSKKQRALKINGALKKLFPYAKIALKYKTNWELIVAVVLSAQATDKKVNEVTPALFKKYKTVGDYAKAQIKDFEKDIKQIGLYKSKAKNIISSAKIIHEKYGGRVPDTMEELISLSGVGRKSANIILGNAFGKVEGIAVDTHVRRLSWKLGLTENTDPDKIEKDLMNFLPKKDWFHFTYRLIEYGRQICPARPHECKNHPLTKIYPPAANRWLKSAGRSSRK